MKTYKFIQVMILISSLWIGSSATQAQQAKNVVLASFISTEALYNLPSSFPYSTPGTDYPLADVWGWTYNGNEYALVCLGSKSSLAPGSGLALVKVTDPNNVQIIKTIKRGDGTSGDNGPRDVRVFCTPAGNWYAFVSQDNAGVPNYYVNLVTALNNPSNPLAGVTDFGPNGMRVHNLHINISNGLLFLSDFRGNFPIPVYDINNVTDSSPPVFKGNIPAPSNGRSHDMTATTTRVYDASTEKGVTITDYTYSGGTFTAGTQRNHFYNNRRGKNPNDFSSPTINPIGHDATVSTNGNYLFTTDERNGGDTADTSSTRQMAAYLKIWDISNINAPPDANGFRYPIKKVYEVKEASATGSFANSYFSDLVSGEASNSIHNVHIRNESGSDVAYLSYYTKGLRILNVANPLSPTELGYYDTPAVSGYIYPVYNGSWGVYPYFNSGTILVSDMRGLYVFRRATEVSGTIATNTTWSNAIFVTGNVTVNSGATLTISPGTTAAFANGASLTINGKLVADSNDPNKRISFTSNSAPLTAGSWNGIIINSGNGANVSTLRRCNVQYATTGITITYTGQANTVTIDKCRISNNSSKGIYVNGNAWSSAYAHPTLSNNYIHHNSSSGITVGNYAKPLITGNQIEYNSAYGIEATSSYTGEASYNRVANSGFQGMLFYSSSHAQVHRNTIEANSSGGVYIFSNSNITAYGGGNTKGRNEITGNTGNGIYANSSSPTFGIASEGNNWIQNNSGYEAQQVGSGYQILAENCYWGGGAPAPSEISGNVDYSPYATTLPNPVGWGQNDAYDPSLRIWQQDNIDTQPFTDVQFALRESAVASQAKIANEASTNGTADLQAAINVGLATGDWSPASQLITTLHIELQNARIPDFDFALVNSYANNSKVAAFIRKMLALVLMEKDLVENKVSPALAKLAAFRQSNSANAAEFLANAGLIHLYRQNDLAAAQNVLAQLQTMAQSGDGIAAEHVKVFGRILQDYQDHQAGADLAKLVVAPSQAPAKLPANPALAQNYPNPFNPETMIRFHLNERQKMRLLIFDLHGKLVRTLIDGELPSGEHTISWDGRSQNGQVAASGVYFYELAAGNKVERKKMTLVR